jgi:hypothetical protein
VNVKTGNMIFIITLTGIGLELLQNSASQQGWSGKEVIGE